MSEIRVAIVEDNPRYRESLHTFLGHAPGFTVVDVFGSAEKLLAHADRLSLRADNDGAPWTLVLMDIELPGSSGIEATRELRRLFPELSAVMLTVFEDPRVVLEAISAGASGYVLKKATSRELIDQLQAVLQGGAPLSPAVASTVIDIVRKLNADTPGTDAAAARSPSRLDLTEREQDVLRCLVRGRTYVETAGDLGISEGTVRTHVRAVYRKLQVHSVAQAIRKAMERGLV